MNTDDYLSLITSQHKTKPKFMASVKASIDPLVDCIDCLDGLNEKFDIETASGDQLQILADWLGAPNSIPNSIPTPFFGFQGQSASLPMRETDDPSFIGGYWRESGVSGFSALKMSKQLFKRVAKASILLNHSDCSQDSAKQIISLVTDKAFKFTDNFDMTITFTFLETYETSDIELVRMMFPKPSGVHLIFEGEDDY